MKTLNDYLMESAKTYEFRLKTCCELSDDQLDSLEKHMRKYEAFDIESPKRTILQSAPLDFHNVGATEIYIMDFKTNLPMSPAMLVNELVQKIGIGEGQIKVRNKLEPAYKEDEASMEEQLRAKREPYCLTMNIVKQKITKPQTIMVMLLIPSF